MFGKKNVLAYKDVNWALPFLFSKNMLYIPVLKELLGEEFSSVKYVYGAPRCLWTGGRPTLLEIKNLRTVEKMINYLKSVNVTPVFNLTNTMLKEEDLNDGYCNDLLSIIAQSDSQVITLDNILHKYICDKYPQVKQTASIITFIMKNFKDYDEETEYINQLLLEYDRVVLRSEYFYDNYQKMPNQINDLSKLTIIINSNCAVNCQMARQHYNLISRFHNNEFEYMAGLKELATYCPKLLAKEYKPNTLGFKYLDKALKMGIKNIKVQGRQLDFDEMFRMLSLYFFNQKLNKQDLRNKIDKISANIIQNSVDLQTLQMMKGI